MDAARTILLRPLSHQNDREGMSKVRVGVIGSSWWSEVMYLPNIRAQPDAQLVASCARGVPHARDVALKYDIPKIYTDYQALIGQGDVDAVVVCTPDDLHHPMTMAALQAGLHVLCEKPLASNAAQAEDMYRAARERVIRPPSPLTVATTAQHRDPVMAPDDPARPRSPADPMRTPSPRRWLEASGLD